LKKTALLFVAVLAFGAFEAHSSAPTLAAGTEAQSLFQTNCSGCHGANGEGAINIAPPLANNSYVTGDPKKVIHAVVGGMVGPIKEKDATWNGSMPPWQGTLTSAQLAEVITYIRSSWGNSARPVTASQVAAQTRALSVSAPVPAVIDAQMVYVNNCSGCHGANGQGAINIAPPLVKNSVVTGDPTLVIRAVVRGMIGPIKERGTTWNGSMPTWNGTLSNAQLAAVITYIRNSWGNKALPITEKQVAAGR